MPTYGAGFSSDFYTNSEWVSADHPSIFFKSFESDFSKFPQKHFLPENLIPWSDSYWPRYKGGIAFNWQKNIKTDIKKLKSLKQLLQMKQPELDALSPSEKYDILNGDYKYSFTKKILKQNPSGAARWHGICHGWAEAAINHTKILPKSFLNKDKIKVNFGYSDQNALISYFYAKEKRGKVSFLGKRCRGRRGSMSCGGVNPGAFHIVLMNSIQRKMGFVADVDISSQVWNQPVFGYEYKIIGERTPSKQASNKAVTEYHIKTRLHYALESRSSWEPGKGLRSYDDLSYWIEVDQNAQVVGGSWVSKNRIDFAWFRKKVPLNNKFSKFLND